MSVQWTFIAGVLYIQLAVVFILLLPFIKPARWQRIFRSGILAKIGTYGHIYFNVFIVILVILFADSIREVRKFSAPIEVDLNHHPDAETKNLMRLFRAQRNFYIAGFALFLWFIIRRLVTLIANQARIEAEGEASRKQASSASQAAQRLLDDSENKTNKKKEATTGEDDVKTQKELNQVKEELAGTKEELKHAILNLKSMKKQTESTNLEYDRLLKEHATLQEKLESVESSGGKKDK